MTFLDHVIEKVVRTIFGVEIKLLKSTSFNLFLVS